MRIFAVSDIHVDFEENYQWLRQLSSCDYTDDALVLAGDVSHDMHMLESAFSILVAKFCQVYFVPGNHDLWIASSDTMHSLDKFHALERMCNTIGITTRPAPVKNSSNDTVLYVVPVLSWYERPEESDDSLYVPKQSEDPSLKMWVDNRAIRWPKSLDRVSAAQYFITCNSTHGFADNTAAVLTFSHFVSRRELLFMTDDERASWHGPGDDPQPRFNFSRVAGTSRIDRYIRSIGSNIHIYGHQHRNRQRDLDGITYISNCLGYPRERMEERIPSSTQYLKCVFDTDDYRKHAASV